MSSEFGTLINICQSLREISRGDPLPPPPPSLERWPVMSVASACTQLSHYNEGCGARRAVVCIVYDVDVMVLSSCVSVGF